MAEFNGIPPVGGNPVVRPVPVAPPPAVPNVEAGLKGGGLSGRMDQQGRASAYGRSGPHGGATVEERRPRRADPDQLAGPSPAFQASVLELERDLQNTIARVEAARGRRESEMAGVTTPSREPAAVDAAASAPEAGPAEPGAGGHDADGTAPLNASRDSGSAVAASNELRDGGLRPESPTD